MTNDGTGRNQSLTFESKPSQSYAKAYYNITTTNENDASSQMEEIYRSSFRRYGEGKRECII